jgi:ABC-type transport system substrate-binding protein
VVFSTSLAHAQFSDLEGSFFSLTILVSPGDAFDYGVYIVEYLKDINIDARLKVMNYDCNNPDSYPKINKDWDLAVCLFNGGGRSPDQRSLFTENGSQNIFNLKSDIPFQNESELIQNTAVASFDLDERQQLYYDWQQLVMSYLVPILPLFTPRVYSAIWSNTEGYDMRWGWDESSPYMSYHGLHEGQESADEFNVDFHKMMTDTQRSIFNHNNSLLWKLISEPIIQWSPDNAPIKTGLIYDWKNVSKTHYKFYMRENITWNPSFNVTERDSTSNPLVVETSPDVWEVFEPSLLMSGLKSGDVSNGVNQQITAKDAVFTLLTAAHPLFSEQSDSYRWLSDCYVDSTDPLTFHVVVDENPETEINEPYFDFFYFLNIGILPEFFLNSTDETATYTSGGIKCKGLNSTIKDTKQWLSYEVNPFSCGKFMLDYYDMNPVNVLRRNPFWFGVGSIDGEGGKEPFVRTVNIYDYPDELERTTIFKSGKLDLLRHINTEYFPWERKWWPEPRHEIQTEIRDILNLVAFNLGKEKIGGSSNYCWIEGPDNKNYTKACAVRKAICYAIDREEMNEVLHDGEYTLCHNPMYLYTAFYYYDDVIKYYNNLDAAWEWMEAAGYSRDLDETSLTPILAVICLVLILETIHKKRIKEKRKCFL